MALTVAVAVPTSIGQELRLSIVKGPGPNTVTIAYPSATNGYFVLRSSTNITGNFRATALSLGATGTRQFQMPSQPAPRSFYSLVRNPLPLNLDQLSFFDQDGDGIDDYYELPHPPLNPLNAADGPGSRASYTNSLPLFAWFDSSSSTLRVTDGAVALPIRLSKPFSGTLRYLVSGTAIPGRDLQPLSGTIAVNGSTASLPLTLINTPEIESARSLVISLQERTNVGPYALSKPASHRLDIIEGDRGVYTGSMGFTNDIFIGPQSLRVALRSGAGNAGIAYFDTSTSTLFTQPFSMQVQFSGPDDQFQFISNAVGTINATNIGRSLTWNLAVASARFTNNGVNASFNLTIQGLAGTNTPLVARGVMTLGLVSK